jgi:hypothetical protein
MDVQQRQRSRREQSRSENERQRRNECDHVHDLASSVSFPDPLPIGGMPQEPGFLMLRPRALVLNATNLPAGSPAARFLHGNVTANRFTFGLLP